MVLTPCDISAIGFKLCVGIKTAHARQSYDEAGYEESRAFPAAEHPRNPPYIALGVPVENTSPCEILC
jgi:hypothetical protein